MPSVMGDRMQLPDCREKGLLIKSEINKRMEEDCFNFLKQFSEVRTPGIAHTLRRKQRRRVSEEFADVLIKGGQDIAWKMNSTADEVSRKVAQMACNHRMLVRHNKEQMRIHPLIQTSVHIAHRGSKIFAKRIRYFFDKVGEVGATVGRHLASTAEKCFGSGRNIGLISDTINILGGGVISGNTIWIAMGNALKKLCSNIANEIVNTIRAKYGEQASMTAHEALFATGRTSVAAFRIWGVLPRSIVVRAAKKASKQLIRDLRQNQSEDNSNSSDGGERKNNE